MQLSLLVVLLSICGQMPVYNYEDVQSTVFNDVASQMNVCSFGKCRLSGHVVPYVISIPCQLPSTCNVEAWASITESFLSTTANIHPESYMYHMYIIPSGIGCNGWAGLGQVGCSQLPCKSWIVSEYSKSVAVYMHELGHNLGLQHAGSAISYNDVGDLTDVVGECCNIRCYNAIHSEQLGWSSPIFVFDHTTAKGVHQIIQLSPGNYFKLLLPTKWVYVQLWDVVYVYTTPPWTEKIFHPTTIEATIFSLGQSINIITPNIGIFKVTLDSDLTTTPYQSSLIVEFN